MFVIVTAKPGEGWHSLIPVERLVLRVPDLDRAELRVAVRVDYGNPAGPFLFKFWLDCPFRAHPPLELVTPSEYDARVAVARAMEQEYEGFAAPAVSQSMRQALSYGEEIRDHFLALMKLKLFQLPASV